MNLLEGWKQYRLGDITRESRSRAADFDKNHLPVFRVNNVTGLDTDSKYHSDNLDRYKIVKPGMFAYNPMRLNIGSIGYCDEGLGSGLVSPDYVVFGCKTDLLYPKFFSYCIRDHHWNHWVQRAGSGSVRVRIYYKDISRYPIEIPPLPEQRKIAEILSAWDEAIAHTGELIAVLEQHKKGLMQRLLTGEVRFPGFEDEWREVRLGDLGKFSKGAGVKKSDLVEDGLPCIRYGEIYTTHDYIIKEFKSFIPPDVAQKSKKIKENDLLFAGSGETLNEIGKCVAYVGDGVAYAGGDVIIFRANKVDARFLSYMLNHDIGRRQMHRLGQGHSVVHVYSSNLVDIILEIPEIEEQKAIADFLDTIDIEIGYYQSCVKLLQEQKKGLMQRLLTGEVRVRV